MRISLILSAAIVLLTVGFCWDQERRIREVQAANARLGSEAAALGIPADHSGKRTTTKLRDRGDTSNDIRGLATGLVEAFNLDPKERWKDGRMALVERLEDLDRAEFEELLALLESDPHSQGKEARDLIGLVLYKYAILHPQAGLDFLVNHPDVLEEGSEEKRNLLTTALFRWRENPEGALKWYRANQDRLPELKGSGTQSIFVSIFSDQDPRAAFALLDEFGLGSDLAVGIFASGGMEHRLEAVEGFRKYSEKIEDPKTREELWNKGLKATGAAVSGRDFERDMQWLGSGGLSPDEMKIVASNLQLSELKPADAGKWISWIAENAGDQIAAPIQNVVTQWVRQDFPAASEWLAAMPADDPARNASISAYSETVARHHPETAVQWAKQLPEGDARDGTLSTIYQNWPKEDDSSKAAAEAFKTAHGIE